MYPDRIPIAKMFILNKFRSKSGCLYFDSQIIKIIRQDMKNNISIVVIIDIPLLFAIEVRNIIREVKINIDRIEPNQSNLFTFSWFSEIFVGLINFIALNTAKVASRVVSQNIDCQPQMPINIPAITGPITQPNPTILNCIPNILPRSFSGKVDITIAIDVL